MPTYEYACKACKHEFEEFQSITAPPVRKCPKCGRRQVERKISLGGAVIFKGGGFYETDYRSEGYRKAQEAEKKASEAPAVAAASKDDATGSAPAAAKPEKPGQTKAPSAEPAGTKSASASRAEAAPAKPTPDTAKSAAQRTPGKSHAREGRGIGNVLQLGKKSLSKGSKQAKTGKGKR